MINSLIVSVLRTNRFYIFAIAPIEVLRFDLDINKSRQTAVPSIPIEYLNEADVLELFVKRFEKLSLDSKVVPGTKLPFRLIADFRSSVTHVAINSKSSSCRCWFYSIPR